MTPEKLYNKITCNGMREMELERFKQALAEYKPSKSSLIIDLNICGQSLQEQYKRNAELEKEIKRLKRELNKALKNKKE